MSVQVHVDLPGEIDFAKIAREAIAAKLTETLNTSPEIIQKLVNAALNERSRSRGYSNDSTIEAIAKETIQSAAIEVLKRKIADMMPEIEKAVETALDQSKGEIAKALAESFAKKARSGYGFKLEIRASLANPDSGD